MDSIWLFTAALEFIWRLIWCLQPLNKMINKKYHTVGTVPKSNRKIVERCKIETPNTQIHDLSLSWFIIDTSIKKKWVKLVLCDQNSHLSEIVESWKCFPIASKMPTLHIAGRPLTWKTAVLSHMWFLIRINLNFQPIGKNNWPQYPFLDNVENHPISINVDIWLLRQVNYKCEQTPKTTYYHSNIWSE